MIPINIAIGTAILLLNADSAIDATNKYANRKIPTIYEYLLEFFTRKIFLIT